MADKIINLETFNRGAITERVNEEVQKVIDNITDPNTDAKKVRKVTLTISFKPNKDRLTSAIESQVKTALAPAVPIETTIMIGKDMKTGKTLASEIGNQIPGQVGMNIPDEEKQQAEQKGDNVIDLQKANNNK